MRLCEHPDFEQAIIRAADHFRTRGMRESLIEKDYYVTEALRIIEQAAGPRVIFKGGTSLSKGWTPERRRAANTVRHTSAARTSSTARTYNQKLAELRNW